MSDWKTQFMALDKDGSGCLSADEMRAHWRGGIVPLDEAMFEQTLSMVDTNSNNIIDIVEFMTMVEVQRDETATASLDLDIDVDQEFQILEQFLHADANSDGYVTRAEIDAATELSSLSPICQRTIWSLADLNDDGRVDFETFRRLYLAVRSHLRC